MWTLAKDQGITLVVVVLVLFHLYHFLFKRNTREKIIPDHESNHGPLASESSRFRVRPSPPRGQFVETCMTILDQSEGSIFSCSLNLRWAPTALSVFPYHVAAFRHKHHHHCWTMEFIHQWVSVWASSMVFKVTKSCRWETSKTGSSTKLWRRWTRLSGELHLISVKS